MKREKIVFVIIVFLILVALFTRITYASSSIDETFSDADDFLKKR